MLWLPTAAAELRHVIRLCYIRPVWMNNEECLSLQNIPASLPLPCARFAAPNWVMLGPRNWGSGERGRRDWGGHGGDWGRNRSSSQPSLFSFFGGVNYSVCRARYLPHSTNICALSVTVSFPGNFCLSVSEQKVSGALSWQLEVWIFKSNTPFPQTWRERIGYFLSPPSSTTMTIPAGFCQCLHLTCRAPVASWISCSHVARLNIYSCPT